MRRLTKARLTALDPIGGPVDHRIQRDARISKKLLRRRRVDEPGSIRFVTNDLRRLAQPFTKLAGEPTYADLRSAHVDWAGGRCAVRQQSQRLFIRIALPDDVSVSHRDIDRLISINVGRNVMQHTVPQIDRIR